MRHQKLKGHLNLSTSHRKAMLANMVTSLVEHNRITTTHTRAKEASKVADRMVTLAKQGTLHARRQIISEIRSKDAAKKLIEDIAPLFSERQGGYTRVIKFKKRAGDNAQLSILEFTEFPEVKELTKKAVKKEKEKDEGKEQASAKASKKASFLGGLRSKKK